MYATTLSNHGALGLLVNMPEGLREDPYHWTELPYLNKDDYNHYYCYYHYHYHHIIMARGYGQGRQGSGAWPWGRPPTKESGRARGTLADELENAMDRADRAVVLGRGGSPLPKRVAGTGHSSR